MSEVNDFKNVIVTPLTTTILNGQTASNAIELKGTTIAGFYTPSALTGTSMTFQASYDGTNFFNISDGTAVISKTVAVDQYITLSPINFYGVRFIKLVSGSTELADREFTVIPYPI